MYILHTILQYHTYLSEWLSHTSESCVFIIKRSTICLHQDVYLVSYIFKRYLQYDTCFKRYLQYDTCFSNLWISIQYQSYPCNTCNVSYLMYHNYLTFVSEWHGVFLPVKNQVKNVVPCPASIAVVSLWC